jgi:hypothetical protein
MPPLYTFFAKNTYNSRTKRFIDIGLFNDAFLVPDYTASNIMGRWSRITRRDLE